MINSQYLYNESVAAAHILINIITMLVCGYSNTVMQQLLR